MQEIEHLVRYSIFCFFFFYSFSFAQTYPDSLVNKSISHGISLILEQNYLKAHDEFSKLSKNYPELPFGYIYLAATEIAKSVDYYKKFNEELIFSYLDSAAEISDRKLSENDTLIWNYYFKGLTDGYYSYFQALRGNYFSAITNGINSIKNFNKCLEINHEFSEAYIAIGTFNYWSGSKSLGIDWLPFTSDKSNEGIKMLEKAISKQSYSNYLAVYSLCWIYIDQNKPNKTIKTANYILSQYPNSRLFTWVLAAAFKRIDKSKAILYYRKVIDLFPRNDKDSRAAKIVLEHKIAMLEFELGNYTESLNLCNKILNSENNLSKEQHDFVEKRFERTQNLKEEILVKLNK